MSIVYEEGRKEKSADCTFEEGGERIEWRFTGGLEFFFHDLGCILFQIFESSIEAQLTVMRIGESV